MHVQSVVQRESNGSRFLEFVTVADMSVTRTQIERRDGLVFMRAKRRNYVVS